MAKKTGDPMPVQECPHCKRMVGNKHFSATCPADPTIHDTIGALLVNPEIPGVARTTTEYMRARNATSTRIPSDITLCRFYGSWAALCDHYGLKSSHDARTICPHCGMLLRVMLAHVHIRVCPENPTVREIILEAMTDECAPGEAVGITEYVERRLCMDPMPTDPDSLYNWVGSTRWCDVLAKFGLVQRRRTSRRVGGESARFTRVSAQVAEEIEEVQRTLALERYGNRGLEVCGEPRIVRGLRTADGRECVAMMIR